MLRCRSRALYHGSSVELKRQHVRVVMLLMIDEHLQLAKRDSEVIELRAAEVVE